MIVLFGRGVALRAAELAVSDVEISGGTTSTVVVSGSISGEETCAVTIFVEIIPRAGARGLVRFTPAPPVDIVQLGDPWPGEGTFSPFDTDSSFADTLNSSVDDDGAFVPSPVTFTGQLTGFPILASPNADGVWDVVLSTSSGESSWQGIPTILTSGTITATSTVGVPAASTWGLLAFALSLSVAGTMAAMRTRL